MKTNPEVRIPFSASCCLVCVHSEPKGKTLTCPAYPDGIPRRIDNRSYTHDRIEADQQGTLVFEPDPVFTP
ncbi:hypothetical protein DYU11_07255 [Fibrisoma montanum]|uniref:Uncharacterized protein n=1 Tax=Fibrisoma montanum TaxID=2305895 RepID=A0A418ME62_9BACT|nr:hypothetical protein [Fibrisoma montanum]RIV25109.1 hypothetical protein DYU11_07255 [Fibrisoma montanum]